MMSKKKKLAKEDWPGEVVFALAECDRIAKVVASAATGKKLKDIPKKDVLATLPHPSGRGDMLCGQAAYQRLHHLAALALKDSAYAETATLGDVFSAFRKLVSARFLSKKQEPTLKNVQSALAEAIQEAASKCRDATHFVPCRLTYAKNAAEFALGKVTFRASKSFNETMASTFTAYLDGLAGLLPTRILLVVVFLRRLCAADFRRGRNDRRLRRLHLHRRRHRDVGVARP
jgi:hypothetical protein